MFFITLPGMGKKFRLFKLHVCGTVLKIFASLLEIRGQLARLCFLALTFFLANSLSNSGKDFRDYLN